MIVRANALDESQIRVELTDGRVQDLTISNFEGSGQGITVTITERIEKKTLRSETINPQSTEPSYQFDDC